MFLEAPSTISKVVLDVNYSEVFSNSSLAILPLLKTRTVHPAVKWQLQLFSKYQTLSPGCACLMLVLDWVFVHVPIQLINDVVIGLITAISLHRRNGYWECEY